MVMRDVYACMDTMWGHAGVGFTCEVDICSVRLGISAANSWGSVWEVLLVPCSVYILGLFHVHNQF